MMKQQVFGIAAQERSTAPSVMAEAGLSRVLWWLIVAMAAAIGASFLYLGLRVDLASNPSLVLIAVGYSALTWFYTSVRRDPLVSRAMIAVGQLFIVLLAGLLLTYAASASGMPYRDAELYAIDRWLGFDRHAYQLLIEAVPGGVWILDAAYLTIQPQTVLIPFVLIFAGQLPRLRRFILAFGLALSATAFIAVFVPAIDALIYVDLAPLRQAAIPPGHYSHIVTLEALRSGAMSTIRLNDLEGLVTFPSFHTANAILFAWALWKVRRLRTIGVVVNVLMILSTPLTGQHYVIDVVAGSLIAAAAIWAAEQIARRHDSARPAPAGARPGSSASAV